MKIYKLLFILISILVTTNSCKEIDKLTQFSMTFEAEENIPLISEVLLNQLDGQPLSYDFEVETNSSNTFSDNDTSKDLIERVFLNNAKLIIVSPEGVDFTFLDTIRVFIDTDKNREIELLIASKLVISEHVGDTIELDIEKQDLSPFLKEENIVLRLEVGIDKTTIEEYRIKLDIDFTVDAKILGV